MRVERTIVPLRIAGLAAMAFVTTVAFSGCSGSHGATISGKVTLNGEPLTRGLVSFYPSEGAAAVGSVQSDGTYSISTGQNASLKPGGYVVTIFANEPPPPYLRVLSPVVAWDMAGVDRHDHGDRTGATLQ